MQKAPPEYWFPAKRYGWGWGLPMVWQGWATLLAYLGVVGVLVYVVLPRTSPRFFYALLGVVTILMGVVLWLKGEPPRWRWGGRD